MITLDFQGYILANKSDCFKSFQKFSRKVENENNLYIKVNRSDHGGKLENSCLDQFSAGKCISHGLPSHRTPQQYGMVERETAQYKRWLD